MDKAKASALIQEQRRRWWSREWNDSSDDLVAHRAERAFFRIAVFWVIIGFGEAMVAAAFRKGAFYFVAAGVLAGGLLMYVQSRRYARVLKFLSEAKTTH